MGLAGELGLGIGDCCRGLVAGGVDDVGRSSVVISWASVSTSVSRTLGAARVALAVQRSGRAIGDLGGVASILALARR